LINVKLLFNVKKLALLTFITYVCNSSAMQILKCVRYIGPLGN